MELIQTNYFKSNITKGQIKAKAFDDSKSLIEQHDPIDLHINLKKAKIYLDELIRENERNALLDWDLASKDFYTGVVTYNQGGKILNYEKDPVYMEIKEKLKERKDLLDMAFKMSDTIYDGEGIEVPKVPVKSERKESLNVRV